MLIFYPTRYLPHFVFVPRDVHTNVVSLLKLYRQRGVSSSLFSPAASDAVDMTSINVELIGRTLTEELTFKSLGSSYKSCLISSHRV